MTITATTDELATRQGTCRIAGQELTMPASVFRPDVATAFPPRPSEETWPETVWTAEEILDRLSSPPFRPVNVRGALAGLFCAQVIRPTYRWLLTRPHQPLTSKAQMTLDPDGFASLAARCADDSRVRSQAQQTALMRLSQILLRKGGGIHDVTIGDFIELADAIAEHGSAAKDLTLLYRFVRELGDVPAQAPTTLKELMVGGKLTVEQLVERSGALDYASLRNVADTLAKRFWADLEAHNPGIDSLQLPTHAVVAWKERLAFIRKDGVVVRGRQGYRGQLLTVRAFYLDLARWAADEPGRWGSWVASNPITAHEVDHKKTKRRVKARTDQRTRERLPVLPILVEFVVQRRLYQATLLAAARNADPGTTFTFGEETFARLLAPRSASTKRLRVVDSGGRKRELILEEDYAFWSWAVVEVLRHTGIRVEELLELTHHGLVQYRLPSTGETVPLLQIAPSKLDAERLILVTPELGEILAAIILRIRGEAPTVPLVTSYDILERTWSPPMPFLFQRAYHSDARAIQRTSVGKILDDTLAASGLADVTGEPLRFTPHDFRRLFVTDAIVNGLPPHIAQAICGHRDINTTMRYKAIYPEETIIAHQAFIARRRGLRPSEEYREVAPEEWDEFLGHFKERKLSLGVCTRAYGTPCQHEHACVRCPALRLDPDEGSRLQQIHDNVEDRIAEAKREGWIGEVKGLEVTLAAAKQKLDAMNKARQRQDATFVGMPVFGKVVGCEN